MGSVLTNVFNTTVLGHRKHQSEAQTLPVGELTTRPYVSTCGTEAEIRIRMLMKHFDEVREVDYINA